MLKALRRFSTKKTAFLKDRIREFRVEGVCGFGGGRGGGEIRDCNCDRGTVLGCGNRGMSFKVFTVCPQLVRSCHMTFLAVTSTYANISHWRSENGTQKSANILFLFDFLQSDQRFLIVKRITTQCQNANLFELSIHGL